MTPHGGRWLGVGCATAVLLVISASSEADEPQVSAEPVAQVDDYHSADAFPIRKPQAASTFRDFRTTSNGKAVNVFQAMTLNGSVADSTNANFLATASPDNVAFSGWGIRGGTGTNPVIVSNFGSWFENNRNIVWTQEIDVNNEGATQPEGSDRGGVGLAVHTGSTYSPDTAITVRRMKGAGSGPGFLRGVVIEGARKVGMRIVAMDETTYPGLQPKAPGTLTALQVARSSDSAARFTLNESGAMVWGSGKLDGDVTLSRTAPSVLTVNGAINDTAAWADFVPECHPTSGSFTSGEAKGRYNRMGQRVFFTINLRISRNGSAAGTISCSLPVVASEALIQTASGFKSGINRKGLVATLGGSAMEITDYAGAYPGTNGTVLALSGTYEAR